MVEAGRTDLTLTVLAEAAGTSDRMLVYYFKTREALLQEAMAAIRTRRRKDLSAALARIDPDEVTVGIRQVLTDLSAPGHTATTRLYLDAAGRAAREEDPFVAFLADVIDDAVAEAEMTARRLGADDLAANTFGTLFAAASGGLAADALATAQGDRVARACESAAAALAAVLTTPDDHHAEPDTADA